MLEARGDGDGAATMFGVRDLRRLDDGDVAHGPGADLRQPCDRQARQAVSTLSSSLHSKSHRTLDCRRSSLSSYRDFRIRTIISYLISEHTELWMAKCLEPVIGD